MALDYIRHQKSKRVVLKSVLTTTNLDTTTPHYGSQIDVSGYTEMALVCEVIANSSADPYLQLEVSADNGTTWAVHTTIDADLTTTANNTYVAIANFGDSVRTKLVNATTTSAVRYTVKAVLKT